MTWIPGELTQIAQRVAANERPTTTVRTLLSWFHAQRRGVNTLALVNQALRQLGLLTSPSFENAWIDAEIRFLQRRDDSLAKPPMPSPPGSGGSRLPPASPDDLDPFGEEAVAADPARHDDPRETDLSTPRLHLVPPLGSTPPETTPWLPEPPEGAFPEPPLPASPPEPGITAESPATGSLTAVSPIAVSPIAVSPIAVSPIAVSPIAVSPVAVSPIAVSPVAVSPTEGVPAPHLHLVPPAEGAAPEIPLPGAAPQLHLVPPLAPAAATVQPAAPEPASATPGPVSPEPTAAVELIVPPQGTPADPVNRIGKLPAANRRPETISPGSTLQQATTLMMLRDLAQLPVVQGREIKGVVSWRSIGRRTALHGTPKRVDECLEEAPICSSEASIFDVAHHVVRHGYVLVRDTNRELRGVVTAQDLSAQFGLTLEPFLAIGELENHLRALLDQRLAPEVIQQARDPSDERRQIRSAADLTFGEYKRLLEREENWDKLNLPLDRRHIVAALEIVRIARNDLMHFQPEPLEEEQSRTIRELVLLLRALREM